MKLHFNILTIALLLFASFANLQAQDSIVISGYVYSSADNTPLEGIKVSTKYREVKSVTTNESGLFAISISDASQTNSIMFVFSYPGFADKEQYGGVKDTMLVYMNPEGEYVIEKEIYYPYSNEKYTNMTSAVEQVEIDYSTQVMSQSFQQLLENSTTQVISASGLPGDGFVLKNRGYSTIFADEKPLVVVDGQIMGNYLFEETTTEGFYQDPLINIDPRNIEEITILKDAPAAAIYGGKASNGVILIKTKDAKVGKTEFDVTGYFGTNYNNKRLPVIQSSEDFKPYLLEQMYGNGKFVVDDYFIEDPSYPDYYRYNNTTDWQDYVFEPGFTGGANLGIRGGDAIAKYFFSLGYMHDEGSVGNTNYNRFNARFNADIEMAEWLTAQAKMGMTYSSGELRQQGLDYANPVLNSTIKAPFLYPYIKDSNNVALPLLEDADELGISNAYSVTNKSEQALSSYNFFGTLNFKFEITEYLEANIRGNAELNKINEYNFFPSYGLFNNDYPVYNQVEKGISSFSRISTEVNIRYFNTFQEVHNLSGIAGLRTNSDQIIQDIGSGVGTPSDEFKSLGQTIDDGRTKAGYQFMRNEFTNFYNLSYNYGEEYFIDITATADGSSNASDIIAWSPAIGLGWDMSRLAGFSYNSFINYLKLRASLGQIARTTFDPYIFKNYYAPQQYYTATGYAKISSSNADNLTLEKTQKLNFGIDLNMLKQRVLLTTEVYANNTIGLLNNAFSQIEVGNERWANNGDLNTLGGEVILKIKAVDKPEFRWNTELSVGMYNTKVSNMENDLVYDFGTGEKIFRNNEKAGSFYGYEVVKVISTDSEANALNLRHSNGTPFKAGDIQFADKNGDGTIDDNDKVIIGSPAPDAYGSWVNRFSYKQFSLLLDISFVMGNDLYNHTRRELESMDGFENQTTATLRRWQVNGQVTDVPTAAWGDPLGNSRFSDRWIEDGSYIRLKRVTFSINLNKWLKSANTSEFYISGINLLTFTNYLGYDPEFAYGSSMLWEGIDYFVFPQNKSIMIGVKFGL